MTTRILTGLAAALVTSTALLGTAWADGKDASEIALFQKAAQDISAAIRTAETTTGGKAVQAEFDEKDGAGLWEVKTVTGTQGAELRIDATSGKVVSTRDRGALSADPDAITPQMLGAPLTDLVAKAEAAGGGKVMSIDGDHENGRFRGMEVEIVKADGTIQRFVLDPADGKLNPVSTRSETDDGDAGSEPLQSNG